VLEEIEANTGERPERVLADKGYLTERTLEAMKARKQKCLIAVCREGKRPFAEIKATMGLRRFALRGVWKVRGEGDLVCSAFNLRRLRGALAPA
jgi:IS5 family transposase